MKAVILCVDDERIVLDSLKEELTRHFEGRFVIEIAESGQEALEILEESESDGAFVPVVVSDHIMPGMQGDALLRQVHARWPKIRNILLTGQASAEAVGRAVNDADLYRYVAKPWDRRDLSLTLSRAVESFFQDIDLVSERDSLERINRVALDLSANLAAESRYKRLLGAACDALDAKCAGLFSSRGDHVTCMAAEGWEGLDAGEEIPESAQALIAEAFEVDGPVRRDQHIAVALRFEDIIAGALVVRSPAHDCVPDSRVTAFAALAAAACRTAALVDALEDDAERRRQLAKALQAEANADVDGPLAGKSEAVAALRREIASVASVDDDVVVFGPPGSPREETARAIHRASGRRESAFITINCRVQQSIGRTIFERVDGATKSTFELLHEGTLYLHGVGELSRRELDQLADYVESRDEARARGERPVLDVRIIGGQPTDAVERPTPWGHTPHQRSVTVPPLGDRTEDLDVLAAHIVGEYSRRHGRHVESLEAPVLRRLMDHDWPGDYRELVNVLHRAVDSAAGSAVRDEDVQLASAITFGQYELVGRVGEGGMGEVWRARHQVLSREAAIKLIRPQFSKGGEGSGLRRFRREAEATAQLRSPHTVELYDFGMADDGTFYFAMELLEGMDLSKMVGMFGPLAPERATWFCKQACRSLIEAHEAGLVHRDLKPANIFAARLGAELDFAKVLDFGLVVGDADRSRLTAPDKVTGTPGYMAPEQAGGEFGPRSDIYALGCTLFYLLTGHQVFEADSPLSAMMKHVTEKPSAPSQLAPTDVPPALDDVVLACLAKKPAQRPASAAELHRRLDDVPFSKPWSFARAADWWRLHAPKPSR